MLTKIQLEEGIPTTTLLAQNQRALADKLNEVVDFINRDVIGEKKDA